MPLPTQSPAHLTLASHNDLQGDSGTDAFRCVEMREGSPWLYQADAYGACGVVHCLLFGDYMEVERVQDAAGACA